MDRSGWALFDFFKGTESQPTHSHTYVHSNQERKRGIEGKKREERVLAFLSSSWLSRSCQPIRAATFIVIVVVVTIVAIVVVIAVAESLPLHFPLSSARTRFFHVWFALFNSHSTLLQVEGSIPISPLPFYALGKYQQGGFSPTTDKKICVASISSKKLPINFCNLFSPLQVKSKVFTVYLECSVRWKLFPSLILDPKQVRWCWRTSSQNCKTKGLMISK